MRTLVQIVGGCAILGLSLGLPTSSPAGALDAPGSTKAVTCSACHGLGGNSPSDTMPTLAGMAPESFKKAIQDYASGRRPAAEMEPFAKMVLQLGLDEVAAYFAGQKREPGRIAPDPPAVPRGRAASVQCASCHGPQGKGDPAKGIPDLTGQPSGYLRHQMLLFKSETRNPADEPLKALKAFMKTIPDGTLSDLAAYYSSLK